VLEILYKEFQLTFKDIILPKRDIFASYRRQPPNLIEFPEKQQSYIAGNLSP